MEYNTGNFEKHTTKNPLKKLMVDGLNKKIISDLALISKHIKGEKITILDAGCGEGFTDELLLSEIDNISVTGFDYSDQALEYARKMNPSVEYIQGNINHLPFEDKSFDIVLCTEVLEHLDSPDKALSEIFRVAKKCVYITVPHEPWFCMGNLLVLKNVKRLGNPIDHVNHWTVASFGKFLKNTMGDRAVWKMGRSFPWIIACGKIK